VNYYDNVVTRVKAYSKGSRSVPEPLLDSVRKGRVRSGAMELGSNPGV